MPPTRIVLIDMPRMLRDIVKELVLAQPDMQIVGEYEADTSLGAAVERTEAEFVISGVPTDEAGAGALLGERPHVKVLAVEADARQTFLWELRPQKVALGEISPRTLLGAIRGEA